MQGKCGDHCSLPFNASSLSVPRIHLIKPANLLSSIISLWFHHPPSSLELLAFFAFLSSHLNSSQPGFRFLSAQLPQNDNLFRSHLVSSADSPVITFFLSTQQPECHPPNAGFFQHDFVPRMASSQCAGKCLTTIRGRGEL